MKYNIQFTISGGEPSYQLVLNYVTPLSNFVRLVTFSFVEEHDFEGHGGLTVYVDISTDGTKTFSVYGLMFNDYSYPSQEVLAEYPYEIVDSGITSINGDYLDGWIDLLLFGDIYRVEITSIKHTPGGGHS